MLSKHLKIYAFCSITLGVCENSDSLGESGLQMATELLSKMRYDKLKQNPEKQIADI